MSETNKTTGGLNRITQAVSRVPWLMAALVLASVLGVLVVAGLEISAWQGLRRLQAAFDTFRPETFYLGSELQSSVTRMNGAVLRFQLSSETSERDTFQKKARDLKESMGRTKHMLRSDEERKLADHAQSLYERYLTEVTPLLEKGMVGVRRGSATLIQSQLDEASAELLQAGRKLADAQRLSLDEYVAASLQSVASVQRSMELSGLLLVVLIGAIAALIYRVLVTPLREKLNETQAVIERQERLASLGTLATGVAHEIRNPLTAIKFRLFSLKKSLPAAQMPHEDVEVINHEINRLERMVKDFLQFARPSVPELINVPAPRVLQEVQTLLRPQAGKNEIELHVEDADGIWLNADRQQLEQVLINLVQNAAESIGRKGSITLRAREGVSKLNGQSAPVVILEVSDTGKGISHDDEARIFDPFFSTKEGGTGLGLSIAARIVEMHGGYIQYQSQINRGTTFSIVLPRPDNNGTTNSAGGR